MPSLSASAPAPAPLRLRRAARFLSVGLILFCGWMLYGHLTGDAGAATRPLVAADYLGMASLAAGIFGLAFALNNERAGAIITLVAFTAGVVLNWRIALSPLVLLPVAATLFLAAARWEKPSP
ncbi:MAG TPA: hypothetical protein VNC50_15840 [Planctomycetia bacterium]|nr:hypothetical protein [Planctomycetia bacterium]